ncbi:uncharacterized protein N7496_012256 [Penicillium cataractarum]|uniref:Uncharacterized protein n=1 Tax=Penicillium cataractarum TaxID=2100454 RepID=A0A9W9USL9_9EURO|nr:uncharacterized protein N7496_012256 [Penicillium cataractarum]KAJ5355044.1 hypothetical protein N7496_012256 [Penicillium cataractarum]
MQEEPRIRQIVKIDVGAALESREGQKYGTAPSLIKEIDVQSNKSSLTSTTTSAPSQVSRNWNPSIVRVKYFRKDQHRMLGRVAVATGANIRLGHSEAKDIFIRVSADVPEKVDDAFRKLEKLESLLALFDIPCQAYTSFVPDTNGLRFCLLELAHLNDIAPRRILLDPGSAIKNNIADSTLPVSCRINPSTNLFQVSEHLRNPGEIDCPWFLRHRETTRCWSSFHYPEIGEPGEDRGAQYSNLDFLRQQATPVVKPVPSGNSRGHGFKDVDSKLIYAVSESTGTERAQSDKGAVPVYRPESTPSPSIKIPGVKTRRPVLPDDGEPLPKSKSPVFTTTRETSGKPTQSDTSAKSRASASSQAAVAKSEPQRSEPLGILHPAVSRSVERRSSSGVHNPWTVVPKSSIQGVKGPKSSPEKPLLTGSSPVSSSGFPSTSQAMTRSPQPVSHSSTGPVADNAQDELIDLSGNEPATTNSTITMGSSLQFELGESSSERFSSSSLFQSTISSMNDARSESTGLQSTRSEISDAPSEYAASQNSESSGLPPDSNEITALTGHDGSVDDQETPRPAKSIPLASQNPVALPDDGQRTPRSSASQHIVAADESVTLLGGNREAHRPADELSGRAINSPIVPQIAGYGAPASQTYSASSYASFPHHMNVSPHDPWSQGRVFGTPGHGAQQTDGQGASPQYPRWSTYSSQTTYSSHFSYETRFHGVGATPMHPAGPYWPTNSATPGPSIFDVYLWPLHLAQTILQHQQPFHDTNFQQTRADYQHPAYYSHERIGSPETIVSSPSGTSGDHPQTSQAISRSQRDATSRPVQERLADPANRDRREFHSAMNQRTPNPSGDERKNLIAKANAKVPKKYWRVFDEADTSTKVRVPMPANPQLPQGQPQKCSIHPELTREVYELLTPCFTTAQVFPGPLELEIQIGIITIMNKLGAAENSFMSFEEMKEVVRPRGVLNGPSTVFFNRLTTLPADISHLIDIHANGVRLFESETSSFNIEYQFHCVLKTGLPLVISIDEKGNPTIKIPKVTLGSVHISYPDRIWDAAAVLRGCMGAHGKPDPEVERAVQYIAKNLWVEPGRTHLRLLTRFNKDFLSVKKVVLKRTTYHRCANDRYVRNIGGGISKRGLQLRVTEIQDLVLTALPSNCDILEATCKSLDDMTKAHRQWWEIALISPAIQTALGGVVPTTIGDDHRDWCPIDILGGETGLITSAPASPTAQSIGHYGLGALVGLATAVVENIDSVGFSNFGPAGKGDNKRQSIKFLEWKSS